MFEYFPGNFTSLGERLTRLASADERRGRLFRTGMKYRRATILGARP
jgi:hypothetical protein